MLAEKMYGFHKGQRVIVLEGEDQYYERYKRESGGATGYVVRFDSPSPSEGYVLIVNKKHMVELLRNRVERVYNHDDSEHTRLWIKKEYLRPFCALNRDRK